MRYKYGIIVITGTQIRAARAALGWTAKEVADRSGLTRETVQRLERSEDVPASRTQSLIDLRNAFEAAGVEFIGAPGDGPGVRLWKK